MKTHPYWLYYHFCLFYILKFQGNFICIKNSRTYSISIFFKKNSTGKKKRKIWKWLQEHLHHNSLQACHVFSGINVTCDDLDLILDRFQGYLGLLIIFQVKIYSPEIFFYTLCCYSTSMSWCSRTDFCEMTTRASRLWTISLHLNLS